MSGGMTVITITSLFVTVMMGLVVLRVPIAMSIGLSALTLIIVKELPVEMLAPLLFTSLNSITLVALPFFLFAGDMMGHALITERLLNIVHKLVGHVRGSLGAVMVLGSAFFGTVCGSSLATVSGVGTILRDGMLKAGYRREYIAALLAATGFLGTLIPSSGERLFGSRPTRLPI